MELSIRDMHVSYGAHPVLRGVSFSARDGERIALLGPNATGKTTLFRCIIGLIHADSGRVSIDGTELASLSPKERARRIAYIPQSTAPAFNYTVQDMVLMGMTGQLGLLENPRPEHERRARQVLEQLEIGHLRLRGYGNLSGGEQQLVLLARALAQDARILLMDEPTANLDLGNQFRVMDHVLGLSQQGYTILFSTHHPGQASLYASRILALSEGKLLIDGPVSHLTEESLSRLYRVPLSLRHVDYGGQKIVTCLPLERAAERGASHET